MLRTSPLATQSLVQPWHVLVKPILIVIDDESEESSDEESVDVPAARRKFGDEEDSDDVGPFHIAPLWPNF